MKKLKALLGIGNAVRCHVPTNRNVASVAVKKKLLGQTIQEDILHEIMGAIQSKTDTVKLVSSVYTSKEEQMEESDDFPTVKMMYALNVIVQDEVLLTYPIYEEKDAFFVSELASNRRMLNLSLVKHISSYVKDCIHQVPELSHVQVELIEDISVDQKLFYLKKEA